jgi:hypothetical protein
LKTPKHGHDEIASLSFLARYENFAKNNSQLEAVKEI